MRTNAIVLDRETGEPVNIPDWIIESGKHPWLVVIITDKNKRLGKTFVSYKEAKDWAEERATLKGVVEVTVVSKILGYGPPSKITDEQLVEMNARGKLWCPYCRKFREFEWDPWKARVMCTTCRVSVEDFHVRRNNPKFWSS
jgi:hypothetical protein